MGTWKKVTVVVDSGAAENVMQWSMFTEIGIRQTERSKNGQGFKGLGGENIKNYGEQVMSVRTLRDLCMAGRGREQLPIRKDEQAYVLDLFVKLPSSVTAPVTYSMEVDAINQVADGRERGRRVTFSCNSPFFKRQEE